MQEINPIKDTKTFKYFGNLSIDEQMRMYRSYMHELVVKSGIGLFTYTVATKQITLNEFGYKLCGFTDPEITYDHIFGLLGSRFPQLADKMRKSIQKRTAFEMQVMFRSGNRLVPVLLLAQPVYDHENIPIAIDGIIIPQIENVLAEDYTANNGVLERFLMSSQMPFYIISKQHQLLFANKHFEQFIRVPLDELLMKSIFDFVQPAYASSFIQFLMDTTIDPLPRFAFKYKHEESDKYPSSHFVFKTTYQGVEAFLIINSQVEAVEVLKKVLTEKDQLLNLTIRSARIGTWDWYIQTGEVKFNEQWAELVGYTLSELEPVSFDTWVTLTHPDDLALAKMELDKCFMKEIDEYEVEIRMKHKTKGWVWILDRGRVIDWDEEGQPKRMVGTHVDVHELKNSQINYIHALDEQIKLNKLKSNFVSNVSHEFRTPLSIISTNLDLMEMDLSYILNDSIRSLFRKYSESVRDEVKRLSLLMQDVFTIGTNEAGKTRFLPAWHQINRLVESILKPIPADDFRRIAIQIPQELNSVYLDKRLFTHILLNIIGNALKFSSEQIQLNVVQDAEWTIFEIIDHGIGISSDDQTHLFESFYRAENAVNIQGTGLGLTIVKNYMEMHHGRIEITSALQKGTTVRLFFTNKIPSYEL